MLENFAHAVGKGYFHWLRDERTYEGDHLYRRYGLHTLVLQQIIGKLINIVCAVVINYFCWLNDKRIYRWRRNHLYRRAGLHILVFITDGELTSGIVCAVGIKLHLLA